MTVGGPVRIKGVYKGDRRTNFTATYSGTRGGDLFDQYATVPNANVRAGNFAVSPVPLIDPGTGLPFPGNVIPTNRSECRLAVSPPASSRFQTWTARRGISTTSRRMRRPTDGINVRVTHNFTPQCGRPRRLEVGAAGRRGGRFGGGGGEVGRGNSRARAST